MDILKFDLTQTGSRFKILNATNGGPWHRRNATSQNRSNFDDFKAARIPYTRNHDCGVVGVYGGPYSHDITRIFPIFDADPYDPASYDFACTDESILTWTEAGTEVFFRLGQTIEHQIKKHGTVPPRDFQKWAVICEHIIRHYNEGWADGYRLNIQYWEIWNEPDLNPLNSPDSPTWSGGTVEQFFDLYETAAKHLKTSFPHLKIGGPALGYNEEWAEDFLCQMQKRKVPLDFFSWHIYRNEPVLIIEKADRLDALLQKYGYSDAESILNEWNYLKGWRGEEYMDTVVAIHGIKGATFVLAMMCQAQHSVIDMLMYYDTRPSIFCGAFDYYTCKPLKGYYPLYWYGMFYDMEREIPAENAAENIYSLCGVDKNGKVLAVLTHYSDEDNTPNKQVALDFGKTGSYEIYLLDDTHDGELIATTDKLEFDLKVQSAVLIKEI